VSAECFRVRVPEGSRLSGFTAAGQHVPILPGEYHVHRLRPKASLAGGTALRFVGAHGPDGDVHIRLPEGADPAQALSVEVQPAPEA
jgi:hypothetical protein